MLVSKAIIGNMPNPVDFINADDEFEPIEIDRKSASENLTVENPNDY